jgi:DNA-binding NtrC family response regulator
MTSARGRVLVVHPDPTEASSILESAGFDVIAARQVSEAFGLLRRERVDAVVTAFDLHGMSGLELCRHVFSDHEGLPVIALVPEGPLELLDQATRAGAFGVQAAPFDSRALELLVDRAVEHSTLRQEVARLERVVRAREPYQDLVGASPVMQELFDLVELASASDAPVLIVGESGTGKELVAEVLHRRSRRARGPFVAINLAALPDTLIESELFGHEKGAFTDARTRRKGLFVEADGGTLMLDEVGELPLHLQPKLLRALQTRRVRPLGSEQERAYDARIVAATNRDLDTVVADGHFREDLFYRLDVIRIEVPPLRSRGSDILLLAAHFLERISARSGKSVQGFSNGASKQLLDYRWPGNVRELENAIERAVALTRSVQIQLDDLPARIRGYRPEHVVVSADDPAQLEPMHVVEERYIRRVLAALHGNKTKAAKALGFDRKTLYRKMQRYQIKG